MWRQSQCLGITAIPLPQPTTLCFRMSLSESEVTTFLTDIFGLESMNQRCYIRLLPAAPMQLSGTVSHGLEHSPTDFMRISFLEWHHWRIRSQTAKCHSTPVTGPPPILRRYPMFGMHRKPSPRVQNACSVLESIMHICNGVYFDYNCQQILRRVYRF